DFSVLICGVDDTLDTWFRALSRIGYLPYIGAWIYVFGYLGELCVRRLRDGVVAPEPTHDDQPARNDYVRALLICRRATGPTPPESTALLPPVSKSVPAFSDSDQVTFQEDWAFARDRIQAWLAACMRSCGAFFAPPRKQD